VAPDKTDLTESIKELVTTIAEPVTSDDIDTYRQLREIEDRSYKLRTIIGAWERQQGEERKLRRSYAGWLLFLLFLQVILVNAGFLLVGLKYLIIEEWVAKTFIIAVLGEIAGMTLVVVRYLFPKGANNFPNIIEKL
jgi:hypothetical protein